MRLHSVDGAFRPVNAAINYSLRGPRLAHMTPYEYISTMVVQPMTPKELQAVNAGTDPSTAAVPESTMLGSASASSSAEHSAGDEPAGGAADGGDTGLDDADGDDGDTATATPDAEAEAAGADAAGAAGKPGRRQATWYRLDIRHPLYTTHKQVVRAKQVLPIVLGSAPRYPGHTQLTRDAAWHNAARTWSRYIMTLHAPWSVDSVLLDAGAATWQRQVPDSWEQFVEWAVHLEDDGSAIARGRLAVINNIACNLHVSHAGLKATSAFSTRATCIWKRPPPDYVGNFATSLRMARNGGIGRPPPPSRGPKGMSAEDEAEAQRRLDDLAALQHAEDETDGQRALRVYDAAAAETVAEVIRTAAEEREAAAGGQPPLMSREQLTDRLVLRSPDELATVVQALAEDWTPQQEVEADRAALARRKAVRDAEIAAERAARGPAGSGDGSGSSVAADAAPAAGATDHMAGLNAGQRGIVAAVDTWSAQSKEERAARPLRLVVHGAAGTGKTFTIGRFVRILEDRGIGIRCSAFTGVAASLLPGARTVHGLLSLSVRDTPSKKEMRKKGDDQLPLPRLINAPNGAARLAILQARFENVEVILIDEMSMVSPAILAMIDQRLREIKGVDLPFGGLGLILCGDFFQIEPVAAECSLYEAMLAPGKPSTPLCWRSRHHSGMLLRDMQLLELTEQVRAADDKRYAALTEGMRAFTGIAVPRELLSLLSDQPLTHERVRDDALLADAPVIVTSNAERIAINRLSVVEYARRNGLPVIAWSYAAEMKPTGSDALPSAVRDARLDEAPEMLGMFVPGAPTQNINPGKGLANGTPVTMHSLCLREGTELEHEVLTAEPGHIIMMSPGELPLAINVEVTAATVDAAAWPAAETMEEGKIVIPVRMESKSKEVKLPPCRQNGRPVPGFKVRVRRHAVELGFSITFHKVQGKTLVRAILDLNKRPGMPYMTYNMLSIALTRVREGKHIAILPPLAGVPGTLDHLLHLRPDPCLQAWRQ